MTKGHLTMKTDKKWKYPDLMKIAGISLDLPKMILAFCGLFFTGLIMWCSFFIGSALGDIGLFIFATIGITLSILVMSLSCGGIAIITKKEIIDDDFMGVGDAVKWAVEKLKALVWTPFVFVGMMTFIFVVMSICLWCCRLPIFGPLFFSILYVGLFLMALVMIIVLILFVFGVFLYPAIIAVENESTAGTVATIFGILRNKWYLVLGCLATTIVFAWLLAYLLGLITLGSVSLIISIGNEQGVLTLMGEHFEKIQQSVPFIDLFDWIVYNIFLGVGYKLEALMNFLPIPNLFTYTNNVFENLFVVRSSAAGAGTIFSLAGFFYGLNLLVIYVFALSYPFVVLNCGGMFTYLIAREENEWDEINLSEPGVDTETEMSAVEDAAEHEVEDIESSSTSDSAEDECDGTETEFDTHPSLDSASGEDVSEAPPQESADESEAEEKKDSQVEEKNEENESDDKASEEDDTSDESEDEEDTDDKEKNADGK